MLSSGDTETDRVAHNPRGRGTVSRRVLAAAACAVMLAMLQGGLVLAGDGGRPFIPDPRATEPGYDAALYEGMGYEPPISEAAPVPPEYVSLSVQSMVPGTINQTTTAYYGPSTSHAARETLYSGKAVSVIEKEGSYFHIQYDVTGGSVRAYVLTSAVSGDFSTVPNANNNINQLGLNIYGSTITVYGGPSTTSFVSIVSVYKREIVTALKTDGSSWYHIEYWTSNGNKRGYVQTSRVSVPWLQYGYSKPITSGSRTADYSSTHKGIDIGVSSGTPVYAITSGSADFRTYYEVEDDVRKFVSYGNFVILEFGSNKAIYAHLSSFGNFYTAPTYPNCDPVRGWSTNTKTIYHGVQTISAAGTQLGGTGNTGYSTGPHLHFEIRESDVHVDPFKYVLFAKMPW